MPLLKSFSTVHRDLAASQRMTTTLEINASSGQLAELVKQAKAGNEVILTRDNQPVTACAVEVEPGHSKLEFRLTGRR